MNLRFIRWQAFLPLLHPLAFLCWQWLGGLWTNDEPPTNAPSPSFVLVWLAYGYAIIYFVLWVGMLPGAHLLDLVHPDWPERVETQCTIWSTGVLVTVLLLVVSYVLERRRALTQSHPPST